MKTEVQLTMIPNITFNFFLLLFLVTPLCYSQGVIGLDCILFRGKQFLFDLLSMRI